MSRKRKEALTPEGAERVKWYADMQQQLFAHPPEPEMSDDDETDDPMEKSVDTSTNSRISSSRAQSSGLSSSRINTASQPVTPAPTFQNFAASLATESKASMDNQSFHSSSTKLSEKPLKSYPKEILSRALLRLNSPLTIRATLVCLLGFNDNGLVLAQYGEYLANYDIELVSIIFPGRLDRTHETPFQSVSEFSEFVVGCLVHHKYLNYVDQSVLDSHLSTFRSDESLSVADQLVLNDHAPSLALFGHNLGGIIAFEVAREIEKATRVRLPSPPLHSLIVSGCRPPQALTLFNRDEKSRKYHRDPDKILLDRMIELGCVPSYFSSRRDMLKPYLSRFRSEYSALESYKLLRPIGTNQSAPPLKCEIFAMCGGHDTTVSERLLMQWGEMTSGAFQHHIFDRGAHYYWLKVDHNRGDEKEREEQSVQSGGSMDGAHKTISHESSFLTILVRASNPYHILLSQEEDDRKDGHESDDDQKSAVSSVTFLDSYRAESPPDGKLSREVSSRGGFK